jgi:hypothetical protein
VGEPPHVGHEGIGVLGPIALARGVDRAGAGRRHRLANQAAMVFEIHVTLAGGSTMIMDAVEVFVIDDDARIAGLSAYWDMSRARTRA